MAKENIKGNIRAVLENKGSVSFDYDLSLFEKPSRVYDHGICRLACEFVTVGYDKATDDPEAQAVSGYPYTQKGLKSVLDGMGFTSVEINPRVLRDEESYFIGYRTLTLADRQYDFYVAAFIGSHKKTWFSNFDPLGVDRVCNNGAGYAGNKEAGAVHLGFADAREFVYQKTDAFIKRTRSGRPLKLLLTGHSRGAATAGLLAAKLISGASIGGKEILPDDIYTYTFASPNYVNTKLVNVKETRFKRIFNVVSPEDFVTEVFPEVCGFGKYGSVYAFFGKDNLSKNDYAREKAVMTRFFSDYRTSRPYVSYKNGNTSVRRIISVMAQSMESIDVFYNKKMRLCFKTVTPYEYFKTTLCSFVGGVDTPEDQKNLDRATKLLLASSVDRLGTSYPLRKLSEFFVFKQGLAGATGGKIGAEYFNDAHIAETYLSYIMSMSEKQLKKIQ